MWQMYCLKVLLLTTVMNFIAIFRSIFHGSLYGTYIYVKDMGHVVLMRSGQTWRDLILVVWR